MNFKPCNWCGGPVPLRKNSCPRCGTHTEGSEDTGSQFQTYEPERTDHSEASRLILIFASFLATALGVYIVMQGQYAGESHFLLIGISFAVFGVCGLVSAERTPGLEMNQK